ncbi:MAG TPA: hypothetical protein VMR97_11655, partial [Acidimicrobiales bacterium]|nr:hypothetical protein [Acidimicrobiales bacterium]
AINDALIVLNINTDAVELAEGLLIFAAVLAGRLGQVVLRPGQQNGTRRGGGAPGTSGAPAATA